MTKRHARKNPIGGVFDQPSTIEQLPRDAATYYRQALSNQVYRYSKIGRKDQLGNDVYQRTFQGEPDGFVAITPYAKYRKAVLDYARKGITMGVPKLYEPVDPETGYYWGRTPNPKRNPKKGSSKRKSNPANTQTPAYQAYRAIVDAADADLHRAQKEIGRTRTSLADYRARIKPYQDEHARVTDAAWAEYKALGTAKSNPRGRDFYLTMSGKALPASDLAFIKKCAQAMRPNRPLKDTGWEAIAARPADAAILLTHKPNVEHAIFAYAAEKGGAHARYGKVPEGYRSKPTKVNPRGGVIYRRNPSDKWSRGDKVLAGSVRGIVEVSEQVPGAFKARGMTGVRLENGNFRWYEGDDLRPLPEGEGRGLKVLQNPSYGPPWTKPPPRGGGVNARGGWRHEKGSGVWLARYTNGPSYQIVRHEDGNYWLEAGRWSKAADSFKGGVNSGVYRTLSEAQHEAGNMRRRWALGRQK